MQPSLGNSKGKRPYLLTFSKQRSSVPYAVINGTINGNVYASEKLELSHKACITGNVHYNVLEMASGASVNGNMLHENKERQLLEHHAKPAEQQEEPAQERSDVSLVKG